MTLTIQFFMVYFVLKVFKTANVFIPPTNPLRAMTEKFEKITSQAAMTVDFAPMLCILFITARMRALEIGKQNPPIQPWAQNLFYMCAYSVLCMTIMAVVLPLVG